LDLLEVLNLPHPTGGAVSLVARQIGVLRDKNRKLQSQMSDILSIARENDSLNQRMHQLTLTLLAADSLEDALASLEWGLHQYFETDFVAVRIAEPAASSPIADLRIAPDGSGSELLAAVLKTGKPQCGKPEPVDAGLLFGAQAPEVGSYALVPLQHSALRGLLAIGSRDPKRFKQGMGFLFLTQLGEIMSARLAQLIDTKTAGEC
jgi:hypothetical protein